MAQTGFTPIVTYNTATATTVPSAANLAQGELAVNVTDKKLYTKDSGGNVVLLASNGGDVTGPASSTNLAVPTFSGTGGKTLLNNSGVTITAGVITATGFSGPLTGNVTGNVSGSSGSCTGNAATVTTNANLTGPITSVGNATSIASQTGTGTKFVMDTSPTITGATLTTAALNGSLGATTPSTVVATTISVSGTSTLSGLTASTGLALNASKQIVSVVAPAFAAKATAVQTVNNTTWTKLQFNSEATTGFDTNSNFDTSTYRFTPTVAGYYQINGSGYAYPAVTGAVNLAIYLNGAGYTASVSAPNVNQGPGLQVAALMYLNGSTDYVEIYMYQSSGGALTCGGNDFSGVLVRSA